MKKITAVSEKERALFREAIGNISPLEQSVVTDQSKKDLLDVSEEEKLLHEADFSGNVLERGDKLFFARPSVQKQTLKRLRRGLFRIDNELDLHGMTVEEARTRLEQFLIDCHQEAQCCVMVVHGKGINSDNKPILKNKVNNWLRQRNDVLAFCSAKQADGGTGAIYLLLKNQLLV